MVGVRVSCIGYTKKHTKIVFFQVLSSQNTPVCYKRQSTLTVTPVPTDGTATLHVCAAVCDAE